MAQGRLMAPIAAISGVERLMLAFLAGQQQIREGQLEVLAELRRLREDLRTSDRSVRGFTPAEKPDALLLVLAASVGDKAFSAREVMERAALLDVALRAALAAAGLDNPRQLGKWLRKAEGRALAGLRLERIGTDHDGIVWRVWRV